MAIIPRIIEGLSGGAEGYDYGRQWKNAAELKAGQSYTLAILPQFVQAYSVYETISKLSHHISSPYTRIPLKCLTVVIPLTSCFMLGLSAVVKDNLYEKIYSFAQKASHTQGPFKHVLALCGYLPEKLSNRAITVIHFIAGNTDNVLLVAMIAGNIALTVLGHQVYGIALLSLLGYQILDSSDLGLIPKKVSLFLETYLSSILVDIGSLLGRSLPWRIVALCSILSYFSWTQQWMQHRIDHIVRKALNMTEGPSLEDIDAPLTQRKELTYQEIQAILKGEKDDFELNYAHCSKLALEFIQLPRNTNFSDYITLFNQIQWGYNLVKPKCQSDDRFIEFLIEKLGNAITKDQLEEDFDHYLNRAAAQDQVSSEEFVLKWYREQIQILVDRLLGKTRITGKEQDLKEAIDYCAQILFYLCSLDPAVPAQKRELEDTLLALTVEGGGYCALGVKRCSRDLLKGIVLSKQSQQDNRNWDPQEAFEVKVYQCLENYRYRIFNEIAAAFNEIYGELFTNVHSFEELRSAVVLGFTPLTVDERYHLSISDLIRHWYLQFQFRGILTYSLINNTKYNEVTLSKCIHDDIGEAYITDYLRNRLQTDNKLKESQIIKLLSQTDSQGQQRIHRLLFVMLGILRPKKSESSNSCYAE